MTRVHGKFGMGQRCAAALFLLCGLALPNARATAMQFEPIQMANADVLIVGRGPILRGDVDRFTKALMTVSQSGHPLAALALDSAGGSVMEAMQMVTLIRDRRITVALPHNTQCASACFLLFAASPRRLAATDALVGVHSASVDGTETDTSLAVTTLMARDARDLGVPPAIVGKMVETSPGRVEWLTPEDLASMNVALFEGDLASALRPPAAAAANPVLPPTASDSGAVPDAATTGSVATATLGKADRRAWEDWITTLHGAYRDGAEFARSRFPETPQDDCFGPNNVNRGDFTLGCTVAQQRLSPVARKVLTDRDYAFGWNTVPPRIAIVDEPVEQEYLGVYFCGSRVARLTVKIFSQPNKERRRALVAFGPHGSDQDVLPGSFLAEGMIDTAAGAITIAPVKWVSQPPSASWFGINGGSDDGGKTFVGQVTDNPTCTRFTLARRQSGATNK